MHNLIGKWSLALTEFSLIFKPLKSMKIQLLVDFMVDNTFIENEEFYVGIKPWKLYFDGSRTDEGSWVGIFIISPNNIPTKLLFGTTTWNMNL